MISAADYPRYRFEESVEDLVRFAFRQAELTGSLLQKFSAKNSKLGKGERRFPRDFIYEAAAAIQIMAWEKAGLRPCLPAGLPDAKEVMTSIERRVLCDPASYLEERTEGEQLMSQVLQIWLDCFAGCGLEELKTDVAVMGRIDDVLDALANFLWENRHLTGEEDER